MTDTKILDSRYYSFNPVDGELTFLPSVWIKKEEILLITNVTRNTILYNFACPTQGGSLNGAVLSFTVDTSEMQVSDDLVIILRGGNDLVEIMGRIEVLLRHHVEVATDFYEQSTENVQLDNLRLEIRDTNIRHFEYEHIDSATTTTIKKGNGTLERIIVNNPTNNTISIYDGDGTTGKVIAIIDPDASTTPFALVYDLDFVRGLTIVTAGTPDLTVVYK